MHRSEEPFAISLKTSLGDALRNAGTTDAPLHLKDLISKTAWLRYDSTLYEVSTAGSKTVLDLLQKVFAEHPQIFAGFNASTLTVQHSQTSIPLRLDMNLTLGSLGLFTADTPFLLTWKPVELVIKYRDKLCSISTEGAKRVSDIVRSLQKTKWADLKEYEFSNICLSFTLNGSPISLAASVEVLMGRMLASNSDHVLFCRTPGKLVTVVERNKDLGPTNTRILRNFPTDSSITKFCESRLGSGLGLVPQPGSQDGFGDVCTQVSSLEEGAVYTVMGQAPSMFASVDVQQWIQNESRVQEYETAQALVKYIRNEGFENLVTMPRFIKGVTSDQLPPTEMEWDGVVYAPDQGTLFLIEAKHSLTEECIQTIVSRLETLKQCLSRPVTPAYVGLKISNFQVVVSGLKFPDAAMKLATSEKFLVAFPSGNFSGFC